MSLDQFVAMYLDWINNFTTVDCFAEHYQISVADAQKVIDTGRMIRTMKFDYFCY
jgi:hypothetical protein